MTQDRELLRRRRRSAGISLDDMALAISVDISTLSRWERGKRESLPRELTAEDYERALEALIAERES